MTNQRLRRCVHENKDVKIAKICDPQKFNSAKVQAYTVFMMLYVDGRGLPVFLVCSVCQSSMSGQ